MDKYYVKYRDYTGEDYSTEFSTLEEAKANIISEIDIEIKKIINAGLKYKTIENGTETEIYSPSTDIYYEWKIIKYGDVEVYINWLDKEQEKIPQDLFDVQFGKIGIEEMEEEVKQDYLNWLDCGVW